MNQLRWCCDLFQASPEPRHEGSYRWMWFDIGYQLLLAWTAALLVTQGGRLLGLA